MKRNISFIITIFLLIIPFGCEHLIETFSYPFISFRNNSTDTIVVHISYNYPDTLSPTIRELIDGGRCAPLQNTTIFTELNPQKLFELQKRPISRWILFCILWI